MLKHIRPLIGLCAVLNSPAASLAQYYPTRAIRLIVPNPASGGNDVIARVDATEPGELVADNNL